MGDFAASELWRVDYVGADEHTPCAGCGNLLLPNDRAYGDAGHIWHAGCWPRTTAASASTQAPEGE